MTTLLLLKLVLVPALIGIVTLIGRRWGPSIAGWLSAFPIVSGPVLMFIASEQGAAFAADATLGTLSAVMAMVTFGFCYAWTATRYSLVTSLIAGFSGYAIVVLLLAVSRPALLASTVGVAIALGIAPYVYPSVTRVAQLPPAPASSAVGDIPLRMMAGATLVLLLTHFAAVLGSRLSGVLSMFPIMASVLAAFSHYRGGAWFAVHLLHGMLLGYYAFAAFCLTLHLTLTRLGVVAAFMVALVVAMVVQMTTRLLLQRRATATRALF